MRSIPVRLAANEFFGAAKRLVATCAFEHGEVLAAGGTIQVRFKNEANSETWDFNLVDDEGLSVTFDKVKLAGK